MEILSWAPRRARGDRRLQGARAEQLFRKFGVAGVFEQDDVELWASAAQAADNSIALKYPYSFHTGLPLLNSPIPDHDGPGRAFRPVLAEVIQFEFMRHWDRLMMAN